MDETTKTLIEQITVTFDKPTQLPSGQVCTVFYDCARLTPNDLARLAAQAVGHLADGAFDVAVGIAYTGIFFAAAVAGGRNTAILQVDGAVSGPDIKGKRVMIVDDVVHTGERLHQAEQRLRRVGAVPVGFACIVDRSLGQINTTNTLPLWSAFSTTME